MDRKTWRSKQVAQRNPLAPVQDRPWPRLWAIEMRAFDAMNRHSGTSPTDAAAWWLAHRIRASAAERAKRSYRDGDGWALRTPRRPLPG